MDPRNLESIDRVRRDLDSDGVPDRVGDTVMVAGRVSAEPGSVPIPGEGIGALQDQTGGIHVILPGAESLRRGDSVRVRGVLRHEAGLAQLEGLGYRRVDASRRVPDPVRLTVPSAAGERHEGSLARVSGKITSRSSNRGGEYFVIREMEGADAQLTVFVSNRHADRIPLSGFEEGDEVAVTGIISQYDLSYQVLPREAGDLAQVGQAQTYLWWALLGVGGVGLASLALVLFLRAAVRRRTEKLRQSREELREKESQLRSITENVSDGIYRSTREEGLVYANQAFVEMMGYSNLEELRDVDSAELYVNPGRRKELIEREARQGKLDGVEVRYQRKDGTTFTGLLSTCRVGEEGDGKTYFDGAITDITERKRRENRLRRRGRMIESLYDATTQLLTVERYDAVAESIHEVLRDVFSYPLNEVDLVRDGKLVPVQFTSEGKYDLPEAKTLATDGKSLAARAHESGETVIAADPRTLDNQVDYGDLRSAAAVPMDDYGVVVIGQVQSSEFDAFELRMIEILASYAALVLDRLDREGKLREAKSEAEKARREAEAASQAKSAFLANMSHEIRTPLTSILGFAEAIGSEVRALDDNYISNATVQGDCPRDGAPERGDPTESVADLRRFAGLIEESGKRLLETLDGVLNLSKLEAGQMELAHEPVDVAAKVRRVAEEFRAKAEEAGVDLSVEIPDASVRAEADEAGIQIVSRNLISNAIKYTEEGGRVWVRTSKSDGQTILEVEDTGIGMPPETADQLFEPFRQESEGIGREYQGTGIGLAVTQRAVEEMNGAVRVETEKGNGSRFVVRLPRP
ncbi:MAG: ATP-binding protein [Salinibacter sp.]